MIKPSVFFKQVIPFVLIAFNFWACSGKESTEQSGKYADFRIEMDTVMVDPGEEILMAATSGYGHAVSKDLRTLYFWDFKGSQIEVIDLDQMAFVEKLPVEKEGPNGVGQNGYQMRLLGNGNLAFLGWDNKIAITDVKGNVLSRVKLDKPWMTEGIEEFGTLSFLGFSEDGSKIYCSLANYDKLQAQMVELDLKQENRRLLPLPEFEKMDKFRVSWTSEDRTSRSMTYPSLNMTVIKEQYLFTTNILNSIYRFDAQEDTLILFQYNNSLTPNEKTGVYKNEVSSQSEIREVSDKIREEINFLVPVWDEKNQVYYRLSYYALPKIADEKVKFRSFISILNDKFELIGEKEITDFGLDIPNVQFVKEGKIYLFLNLDDELAYMRLTIE